MRIRIKYFFIVIILFCVLSISAKSKTGNTDIAVYANASVYSNPAFDSVSLVEFPFTLNRNNFEFYKPDSTDSIYFARIFAHVVLMDIYGIPVDSTNTLFTVTAASLADAAADDFRLFNKLSLFVKPGIYSARVIIIDVVSKNKGEYYIDKITVENSSQKNSVNLSALNSAYSAEYVESDSTKINLPVYKNGYDLLINPISVFADKDKYFYLYGEIYNLDYSPDTRTKYQLIINALDKNKNIYQMFGSRLSKKPGSSAFFVEKIDIAGWNKGIYTIEVIVVDLSSQKADTSYLPLSIVSPQEVILAAQEAANSSDPYNSLNLKQQIQLSTYMLNSEELKILNNLGDKGKANFLKTIWAEHDPTKGTDKNEFRDEILSRYFYANKHFSTNIAKSDGWNTDRGRIYMEYGKWERRSERGLVSGKDPIIIWNYYSLKGTEIIFIFVDRYRNDDYLLVHSTADGEVYSKEWEEYIINYGGMIR